MESTLRDTAPADLVVIETLGYTPKDGFARLGLHMDRAEKTCAALGFGFDRGEALFSLGSSVDALPARVRMTIAQSGEIGISTSEMTPPPERWRVTVSDQRLASDDPWLRVKTSQRGLYDSVRAVLPSGVDEVIFLNENNEVCEGTITTVFVQKGDVLLTPSITCGVLPGILRQELIENGQAQEAVLSLDDLRAGQVFVGNSLRGLIAVDLL